MIGVSVIIPTYNGGNKLLECIKSVIALNYGKFEIIIVDNGSNDGTKDKILDLMKDIPIEHKIVFNKDNTGVAKATNHGIAISTYPLILTLDQDVILDKDCLSVLVRVILSKDNIGAVSPKIFNQTTKKFQGIGFTLSKYAQKCNVIGEGEEDKYNQQREIDFVPGAVVLSRKDIALMDEDYFLYYSDAQYCKDIRDNDFKVVYVPSAIAWHDCNTAEGFTPFRLEQYIKSKLFYAQKNSKYLMEFFFIFFFAYVPKKLLEYSISKRWDLIKALFKGIWAGRRLP